MLHFPKDWEGGGVFVVDSDAQLLFCLQVAQFVLDDAITKDKGSTCRVVCTQPRRISAISVSDFG